MITTPVACVVDASVAVKLVLSEPDSALAMNLFAHLAADPNARFYVPELFYLECGNILWKHAYLQSAILPVDAQSKFAQLKGLPLTQVSCARLATDALTLALRHGTTTYDACYVAASALLGVPLVTADDKLVKKLAGAPFSLCLLKSLMIPAVPPTP